jgi:hypothetical protein
MKRFLNIVPSIRTVLNACVFWRLSPERGHRGTCRAPLPRLLFLDGLLAGRLDETAEE